MSKFNPVSTPGPKSRPLDAETVRRAAFGRWPDILLALGVSADALARKRNQPCPACGGVDRFQFIDKGQGRFVCRSLDSLGGDGFTLAMHFLGCDFKTALQAVAGALGLSDDSTLITAPARHAHPPQPVAIDPERQRVKLATIWNAARAISTDDPAGRYLAGRGLDLTVTPAALRCHPCLPYWAQANGKPVHITSYPALIAAVTSPKGVLVGLHRIYLDAAGRKARPIHPDTGEAMPVKKLSTLAEGSMLGAAIHLYEPENGVLALAEGIETALAVRLGTGLPCWAAVSAWGLEHVALPEDVREVYVMGDNDTSGTGQRAAEALGRRLLAEERQVRVVIPDRGGADWLDILNERKQEVA